MQEFGGYSGCHYEGGFESCVLVGGPDSENDGRNIAFYSQFHQIYRRIYKKNIRSKKKRLIFINIFFKFFIRTLFQIKIFDMISYSSNTE